MRYTVVIPTLNEEGNIGRLVRQLKTDSRCSVIVSDNGSTDDTVGEAKDSGAIVLGLLSGQPSNSGVAGTIEDGLKFANDDLLIVMDADGSHPPELVPELAQKLVYHDMVYGYREDSKDSLLNKIISSYGKLFSLPISPKVKDRMTGFFGIKKHLIEGIEIDEGPKPFLEYIVRTEPISVEGLPYVFKPREVGESKLGRKSILLTGISQLIKLNLMKHIRLVKYCVVGGGGALIYLGFTIGAQELTPIPYYIGAFVGALTAFVWNFVLHGIWTFAQDKHISLRSLPNAVWNLGHDNDDGNFDWWEWTSGLPHKKFKRVLGRHIYDLANGPKLQTEGGSVLSLGCGSSPILNMFDCPDGSNKDKLRKVGIDINPAKIDFFQHHVDIDNTTLMVDDITELDYNKLVGSTGIEKFDLILCNEVVEHFDNENLTRLLKLMFESVKPGGRVIISTPDTSSKTGNLVENFLHGEFHVGMLDSKSLITEVRKSGLRYVESRNYLWDKIHLFERKEETALSYA